MTDESKQPMAQREPGEVTRLLLQWRSGDAEAFNQLIPLVYDDLRRLAHQRLRHENCGQTMETRALVHETYFRLVNADQVDWNNRLHFFAIASNAMRRVLVERARRHRGQKHGGAWMRVSFDEAQIVSTTETGSVDLLALDEALEWLKELAPRQYRVVVLRCFGGVTLDEIAQHLEVHSDTVKRDWQKGKRWLKHRMGDAGVRDESSTVCAD